MEEIILSHFEKLKSFRNFFSLFKRVFQPFYFSKKDDGLYLTGVETYHHGPKVYEIFLNGWQEGLWLYYINRKISEATFFKNGERNGFNARYNVLGSASHTFSICKDGWINGFVVVFYEPNSIKEMSFYGKHNLRNGLTINYWPNGKKATQGFYLNNRQKGLWIYYDYGDENKKSYNFF